MKTEWVHKKLGECCNRICNGLTYDVEETQGYLVTRIETISDGYIDYNKIGHINDKPNQDYLMVNGDILFSHINSVKHIGKVAYYDDSTELYHGMNLLLLRANNSIDKLFLFYLLSSDKYRRKIRTLAKSAVNQASISTTDLGKFELSYPNSLPAQRHIAAILSSADKVIASTQKVIAKYKQMKQGMMEDLLKPKEGWKMVRLGDVGEIITGLTYSPNNVCQEGVLVLRSSNIQDDNLCFEDNVYVDVENYNPVIENDILICVRNGSRALIGKTARITKEVEGCAFGAFMLVYRSSYNDFLYYFFKSDMFFSQVSRNIGATINSINGSDLKNMEVYMPSDFAKQRRIASILSGIDSKIAAEEKVLEKYGKVKKGLMERMLEEKV